MTEAVTLAIVAAIGGYGGSVYALSRRHPRVPDATAQAYRDLRTAFLDISVAHGGGQALTDAMSEASKSVSRVTNSASFLIAEADLDLVDSLSEIDSLDPHERVDQLDRVIAYRTYRRKCHHSDGTLISKSDNTSVTEV